MAREIIVCDDEPHIIRAISLKLTRAGFDVKGATDTQACWKLLQGHQPPALLIVDDSLPHSDGLELVRRVRSDARLADVPIVVLTSHDFDLYEYKEQLSHSGIAQVLTKPFSPRELLGTVSGLVHQAFEPPVPALVRHQHLAAVH